MGSNPLDLTDRLVLITGASSGIGQATAILLSCLGATIILTGRDRERLEGTYAALMGKGHRVEPFDLREVDKIPGWMKSITEETGPLHGLVHAAGTQSTVPLKIVNAAKIREIFDINLHSAILLARGFFQKNQFVPGGSVVFVASIMGLVGSPAISVYSASKAALIGLTRSLALEFARDQVRVNSVAPAFVQTAMLDQMQSTLSPESFAALEQAHPLGFGTPRDIANAIAFLLADTGRWITGTTLVVDGGYTAR